MKIATWYNISSRRHEATVIGRGRPFQMEATVEKREKSKRVFGAGSSKDEAVTNLCTTLGVSPSDVTVVPTKETKIVYKGKRQHNYTKTAVAA